MPSENANGATNVSTSQVPQRGRTVEAMEDPTDIRAQVRDFLVTRRNRLTPEAAGLPVYGGNRRVPGLRREELAILAGISADCLVRLERGDLSGASESALEGLAAALQLDEAERGHLYDLARASSALRGRAPRLPAGEAQHPVSRRPGSADSSSVS